MLLFDPDNNPLDSNLCTQATMPAGPWYASLPLLDLSDTAFFCCCRCHCYGC